MTVKRKPVKKSTLLMIGAFVLMAAAIAVLAVINAPKEEIAKGAVTLALDGEEKAVYSIEQLKAMEYVEVYKKIASSSHADEDGIYRGVALRRLIGLMGEDALLMDKVYVYAQDGYMSSFAMSEVTADDSVFLAYSRDGESLGSLESGGAGPLRIIVSADEFGTRFCKYIYKIEVK